MKKTALFLIFIITMLSICACGKNKASYDVQKGNVKNTGTVNEGNTAKYELTDRQDTATPPCTSLRPGAGYCRQCFDKANETGSRTKEANENRTKTKTGGSKENERFGCRYGQQRQNSDS